MLFLPSAFLPWKWSLAGLLPAGACVCVGGVAFPFRDAALLGAEQRLKPTHWPCVFNFTWILWSSKWGSGVSFQPAFLEVWQGSGSRAEASSGNGH